jgi:UrcA family protein
MKSRDVECPINQETAMKNFTTPVAAAAFAAAILITSQSNAGTDHYVETVRFADLNMAKVRDNATLYERIDVAAHKVCSVLDAGSSLSATMRYSRCWHSAVWSAVATINIQTLTAYASARGFVPGAADIQIARRN